MNNLDEIIYVNRLLDFYGNLLTLSQREIMNDYYECNLSLTEISEERGISRTAVSDALKKGRTKLEKMEEKLGYIKTIDEMKKDPSYETTIIEFEERIKNGI